MKLIRASMVFGSLVALVVPSSSADADDVVRYCGGREASIVGTAGDDDLAGSEDVDVVWMGAGDDFYENPGGGDFICGGSGNDFFSVPWWGQTIEGGPGWDQIYHEPYEVPGLQIDLVAGEVTTRSGGGPPTRFAGVEEFAGSEHNDLFLGDDTDTYFAGLGGVDHAYLRGGDDMAQIGSGWVYGGAGDDSIHVGWGPSDRAIVGRVWAVPGDDYITGSRWADILHGNAGDDIIEGRAGDDTLVGNHGNDTLRGGRGIDRCLGEIKGHCENRSP